jgi:DHA2 family multidrug resistance protein
MSEAFHRRHLPRQGYIAVAMIMASILTAFDVRTAGIGLSDLRGAFGLGFDEGAWLSTFATAPQILVAPSIGWLIAVFGVKRVMVGPTMLYSVISVVIPFAHEFNVLVALHAIRAVFLGMFVGATLLTAFRNLDRKYWTLALSFYVLRIPFAQNLGLYTAGSYTETIGWQWLYWQGAIVSPMIGILFWYGAKPSAIDHALLKRADWVAWRCLESRSRRCISRLTRAIGLTGFSLASSYPCWPQLFFSYARSCGTSRGSNTHGRMSRFFARET